MGHAHVTHLEPSSLDGGELLSHVRGRLRAEMELAGWPPELVDDACLAVSEVVTNALVHGGAILEVTGQLADQSVRVEVRDPSAVAPQRRSTSPNEPGGRGLRVLDAITHQWGVTFPAHHPGHKVVWFTITQSLRVDGAG